MKGRRTIREIALREFLVGFSNMVRVERGDI
jgi:hypothetical protein